MGWALLAVPVLAGIATRAMNDLPRRRTPRRDPPHRPPGPRRIPGSEQGEHRPACPLDARRPHHHRRGLRAVRRGTRQDGTLGYCAYASTTGRGYLTEGLRLLVRYAFGELGLHRIEANIQPANAPSLSLIKRVGFQREGYSANFQFIDGAWRDHERGRSPVQGLTSTLVEVADSRI
ncbi:GNAT family N-acetyltransferase [Nonomuraea sp. NPDC049400]|uniref:GNAT family N-acetyltransferase n=1 Tax=Nonomuraea sp. NPDC049400 TaxID=3364352 RepID=UPI00379B8F2D